MAGGAPRRLRVDGAGVSFCDATGAHRFAMDGSLRAAADPCTGDDSEGGQGCGADDVTVMNPQGENGELAPFDSVMIAGGENGAFALDGHVQDYACDGLVFVVATGKSVWVYDAKIDKRTRIGEGAYKVAIGPGWIAWHDGRRIEARRR